MSNYGRLTVPIFLFWCESGRKKREENYIKMLFESSEGKVLSIKLLVKVRIITAKKSLLTKIVVALNEPLLRDTEAWYGYVVNPNFFYIRPISSEICCFHIYCILHTVTKAIQNEAPLWKHAVLGMEKDPADAGTFCTSPILVFNIPPCRKCPPSSGAVPSAVLMPKDSVKASK